MTPEDAIQPEAAPADSGRAANDQLRQLIMQIGQLSQNAPEAKQELDAAASMLTRAMLKLTAGQQEQQPSQPMIGA